MWTELHRFCNAHVHVDPSPCMNPHVLLINPRLNPESQNTVINRMIGITFPSSLGILAGCLMSAGMKDVQIVDEQIDPIDDTALPGLIESMSRPRIVGLSVLTLNSGRAFELTEKIKQIDPSTLVVLGGIHPTVAAEESIRKPGVDIVVRGEGELTFNELVSLFLRGMDCRGILGVTVLQDGQVFHQPGRPLIDHLDEIPPFPFEMFESKLNLYPGFSSVTGSRGCPYNCSFCSSRSISGRKYRFHSVGRVLQECRTLIRKYKQTSVFFMDDNIAVNKNHFTELCDGLIGEGLSREAYFHGSMRGDNATDEVLEKAREANFKIIYFGLETGSERLMKLINKGETVAEVAEAVRRTDAKGLAAGVTIIFGLPTETQQDRRESIRLVRDLPLASARFNTLAPYPGTPAYESLSPQGKVLVKTDWTNFGVQYMWEGDDIPYVPDGTTRLELILTTMLANMFFYLSPRGLWRLIKSPVAGGNVIRLKKKWFLRPGEVYKMGILFAFLFRRFLGVFFRRSWEKMTTQQKQTVVSNP